MVSLAVVLLVRNGEEYINSWLDQVIPYATEIIILSNSQDKTNELIIKRNEPKIALLIEDGSGDTIFNRESIVRQHLDQLCFSEWILHLDVDERLDIGSFLRTLEFSNAHGYFIPRYNFWGSKEGFRVDRGWYPDLRLRLYRNLPHFRWVGQNKGVLKDTHASVWWSGKRVILPDAVFFPILNEHICHLHRIKPTWKQVLWEEEEGEPIVKHFEEEFKWKE